MIQILLSLCLLFVFFYSSIIFLFLPAHCMVLASVCSKNPDECLPLERGFKVPNVDKVVEEGKKVPLKHRTIKLRTLWEVMPTDMFTASGWPSVSGDALKIMAGKVSAEEFGMGEDLSNNLDDVSPELSVDDFEKSHDPGSECGTIDKSSYGTAYEAFGGGKEGKEACHAIAALCEVCSIDSLISNFILPLQVIIFLPPVFGDICVSMYSFFSDPKQNLKWYFESGAMNVFWCYREVIYLVTAGAFIVR